MPASAGHREGHDAPPGDCLTWQIDAGNPVIRPGQLHPTLDTTKAGAAHVIEHDGRLIMVYWGGDKDGAYRILRAAAPLDRPNDWQPLGPMIEPQPETEHNCQGPGFPFLLPVDQRYWLLYFCGWGRPGVKQLPNTTGVAISEDAGRTWRYFDRHPIIALDRDCDRQGTGSVWVLHEDGRFRMWYTAISRYEPRPDGVQTGHGQIIPRIGIGYAESDDGLTWHKPDDGWVVSPRGFDVEPYEYIVSKPAILVNPSGVGPRYTMWVNTFGVAYRVHRLVSDDGIAWQWTPRVGPDGELGVGAPGRFDDHQRSYPTVLAHDGRLHAWFTGNRFGATGMGYATAAWSAV